MVCGAGHSFDLRNPAIRKILAIDLPRVKAGRPTVDPPEDRIQFNFRRSRPRRSQQPCAVRALTGSSGRQRHRSCGYFYGSMLAADASAIAAYVLLANIPDRPAVTVVSLLLVDDTDPIEASRLPGGGSRGIHPGGYCCHGKVGSPTPCRPVAASRLTRQLLHA